MTSGVGGLGHPCRFAPANQNQIHRHWHRGVSTAFELLRKLTTRETPVLSIPNVASPRLRLLPFHPSLKPPSSLHTGLEMLSSFVSAWS